MKWVRSVGRRAGMAAVVVVLVVGVFGARLGMGGSEWRVREYRWVLSNNDREGSMIGEMLLHRR